MKKSIIVTLVSVAAISGIVGYYNQVNTEHPFSPLALANIEALTRYELPEVTIECSGYRDGTCYTEDYGGGFKMCREFMFCPCVFSGVESDYCYMPC